MHLPVAHTSVIRRPDGTFEHLDYHAPPPGCFLGYVRSGLTFALAELYHVPPGYVAVVIGEVMIRKARPWPDDGCFSGGFLLRFEGATGFTTPRFDTGRGSDLRRAQRAEDKALARWGSGGRRLNHAPGDYFLPEGVK